MVFPEANICTVPGPQSPRAEERTVTPSDISAAIDAASGRSRVVQPDYWSAAVCERGHVEASAIELRDSPLPGHCVDCGAPVRTRCPYCSCRIRGRRNSLGLREFIPAPFCENGHPFPWASDNAIRYHIENQLTEDTLGDAERRGLQRKLEVLLDRDAAPRSRAQALRVFQKVAPSAYSLSELALRAFVTDEISHLVAHMK